MVPSYRSAVLFPQARRTYKKMYHCSVLLLGVLLCVAFSHARISVVPFVRQANIYEWLPGDGTSDKANALGANLTVGWHTEGSQSRENRALLGFHSDTKLPRGASAVAIVLDILPTVDGGALRACRLLQAWGTGTSNATDPVVGAPATTGDATWRFPIYNASNPRTPYWDKSTFGGIFSEDQCAYGIVESATTQVRLTSDILLDNLHAWLITGYGLILLAESGHLITLTGVGARGSPRLVFQYPPEPLAWYVYAIPAGIVSIIALVVVVIYLIRRRRLEYIPLHDLNEIDNPTQIVQVWRTSLMENGVRVVRKEDIQWGGPIGSGASGTIYNGILGNIDVAIKCVNPKSGANLDQLAESLIFEVAIMSSVKHKYILPIIGIIVGTGRREDLGFVMPLMPEGSLARILHKEKRDLTGEQEKRIALQMALALQYLHTLNPKVLHRDVKSDNILVDKKLNCKLSDFGISRVVAERDLTVMGTAKYMAPEAIRGSFTTKTDTYAYGVVLMEIITRQRPPDTFANDRLLKNVLGVEMPEHELRDLTVECLEANPDNRPSDAEVISCLVELGARE